MVKKLLLSLGIFLLIVGAAVIWQFINVRGGQQGGGNLKEITIGDAAFFVEIADTPATRTKGLSGHKQLKENEGMLFIFEKRYKSPAGYYLNKEKKVCCFCGKCPPRRQRAADYLYAAPAG